MTNLIKAIIVEDEARSRKLLESLILGYCPSVTVVGTSANVEDAYQLIISNEIDVVFLDIEMQKETGFDLLSRFKAVTFEIIFTTAFEHYALKAIKMSAIDYLLKPIDVEELKAAVAKVELLSKNQEYNKRLSVLMDNKVTKNTSNMQLALPSSDGLTIVLIKDILYLKSDRQYTLFYLKSGDSIMTSKNLGEYEEILSEHNFLRVHHSSLINLTEAKKYIRGEGGSVMMSNGVSIDVSKRKKENFLKFFIK